MAVVQQAGAIVVRREGADLLILIETAKRNPEHWIFPKGHVEPGESVEAAAVRETREETGVEGTIVGPAGTLSHTLGSDTYVIHYFLIVTNQRGHSNEGRRLSWCRFEEAVGLLTFEDARGLLRAAWPRVESSPYSSPFGISERE